MRYAEYYNAYIFAVALFASVRLINEALLDSWTVRYMCEWGIIYPIPIARKLKIFTLHRIGGHHCRHLAVSGRPRKFINVVIEYYRFRYTRLIYPHNWQYIDGDLYFPRDSINARYKLKVLVTNRSENNNHPHTRFEFVVRCYLELGAGVQLSRAWRLLYNTRDWKREWLQDQRAFAC